MRTPQFLNFGPKIKSKKKIVWISPRGEMDGDLASDWLDQIQTSQSITQMPKNEEPAVIVVSLTPGDAAAAQEILNDISAYPSAVRILHLSGFLPQNTLPDFIVRFLQENVLDLLFVKGLETMPLSEFLNDARLRSEQKLSQAVASGRAESLTKSKIEIEKKVQQTRALVRFVQGLTAVVSVEDIMQMIHSEIKSFRQIKPPILAYAPAPKNLMLMFLQGARFVKKTIPVVWSQQNKIRMNDKADSQFLADIFGRPFGKLLTIPLQLRRKTSAEPLNVSAVLFFEHALSTQEIDIFLKFFEERLLSVSIAFDRLLLEQDLRETSLLWERTFDGLQDPVAIFDSDGHILRANKAFTENLQGVAVADLHSESLRHGEKFYEVHSYPISIGAHAPPTSIINHYVDVTLAHRLQKQMIQNEKMAAIGHLAGHIAHELNNPLTGVRSLAQVLLGQVAANTTLSQDLAEVEKAAERCQEIIRNLLDFSSGGYESQQVAVSLSEIVQRTLPLLKTLMSRFDLQIDLTTQPDHVFVQPQLMQQVVFNIVKNAAQAMGESGKLTIHSWVDEHKNTVNLSIKDTGAGIPEEIRQNIFDFFFTTKSPGQGTGLGLSMSKNIVDRFNGRIDLESELGRGSNFIIILPHVPPASQGLGK